MVNHWVIAGILVGCMDFNPTNRVKVKACMLRIFVTLLSLISCLPANGQKLMIGMSSSFTIGYGYGKLGYYLGHHPVFIGTRDEKAFQYSPSWSVRWDKHFWLSEVFEFSIGISHLTITEKSKQTATPIWLIFDKHLLSQGFFHIIPEISMRIQGDHFKPYLGIRAGTANFFGNNAREYSNALGELNADFGLEYGVGFRLSNRFRVYAGMIQGLTKYDYYGQEPVSYYKYHTFQGGMTYQFHEKE